ncbi:GAP family protein [Rhodococcus globerulus]|uniref:GAP family protein n=1 Tax=Rhodococcus globerulus TaxID=33008 RepID=UPI003017D5DA
MDELIVQLLPEVAGLMITPGAIIGCILLLQSRQPVHNAVAFAAGFLVVYVMIAVSALLGGASDPGSTTPETSHGAGLVIGLIFLSIGSWTAVRQPRPVAGRPRLLRELDTAHPPKAFILGVALGAINPNLFLMISGMSIIASSTVGVVAALLATLALLIAAFIDFLIPIGAYLALGERARTGLDAVEAWMLRNSRTLTLFVLFGFGALFTVRGVVDLM